MAVLIQEGKYFVGVTGSGAADDPYMINDAGSPAKNAFAITPDDDADLTHETRAIYIGGDGNLNVNMVDSGSNITFVGLTAGTILPVAAVRVLENTTATNLIGLY